MRKIKKIIALIMAFILALCLLSCDGSGTETSTLSTPEPEHSAGITSASSENGNDSPPTTENGIFAVVDPIIDEAVLIMGAVRQDNLSSVTFDYEKRLEYDILNTEEKALYDEMISKVRSYEPFIYTADEYGYDVLDRVFIVFGAIKTDCPELENYFTIYEVLEGNMTAALESRYFMPWNAEQEPAEIDALREETELFDAVCERIVERMPEGLSAYDRYRYLATVISLATDYDYDFSGGWQVSTAYGSIVGGHSICQGYSKGFMTLCERAGLWCVSVEGVAGENDSHMWNMVKLDTGYYHVDVTWSDELGTPVSEEWLGYFMLTEDEICVDHIITTRGNLITEDPTPGNPSDTDTPEWQGEYIDEDREFSIEIADFDGTGFCFEIYFLRNGSTVIEGIAALYPDDSRMAEYGEMSFYLYDDSTAVDFFVSESSEWANLHGHYIKIN